MLKIPRQQVLERWDALPDNLKEALCSESNSSIVWQIGGLNHLSEEKISMMATIVGDVIRGFLHPDDLTREIQESLNLNPQIANSISREINRKIFAPIRIDLEKIYSPVTAMPFDTAQGKPEMKPPTKPFDETQGKPEAKFELPEIEPKPIPVEPPTETELKPASFPAAPTIPAIPTPTIPTTPIPAEKPFILHQETESKPVGEKKRGVPPIIGWFRKEKPKKTEAPVKVQIEEPFDTAQGKEKKEPIIAKTEAPRQKVIHYREVEMPTPFGKAQGEPFGKPGIQPPKETQPPKPEEPKIISLDSFKVIKEKDNKSDS